MSDLIITVTSLAATHVMPQIRIAAWLVVALLAAAVCAAFLFLARIASEQPLVHANRSQDGVRTDLDHPEGPLPAVRTWLHRDGRWRLLRAGESVHLGPQSLVLCLDLGHALPHQVEVRQGQLDGVGAKIVQGNAADGLAQDVDGVHVRGGTSASPAVQP